VDPLSELELGDTQRVAVRGCLAALVILLVLALLVVCLVYGAYSLLVDLWP
jgi:hypothetical protein